MRETEWFEGKRLEKLHERCFWRRVGFAVFISILVLGAFALMMFPKKANAALRYQEMGSNGQMAALRLSQAPCEYEKVLKHIKPQFHPKFKAAVLTWAGKDWQSCYVEFDAPNNQGVEETFIFSVDEEGSQFNPVPKRMFREDSI